MDKKKFYIDLTFPKLRIEGEYDVNLVLFNIPIKSTGPVYINASKCKILQNLTWNISNYLYYKLLLSCNNYNRWDTNR